ncbi:uncharacterized protein FOMMEDRAFT_159432 [Fomitiporia mediterranea MF3/22]|uniref:uncharacterized protein n=1 Tax=Fomitiporia mediterranea (strain MF3/22) TaxID=694068 RepID=UPI00044077E0|nr:uncharacterized protein FOMMEDRAFT_159432 [Fomitiporia mediterranea MF3/22]EJD00666.1 hypothetical protein FOMMEDRAFT_159432 [Fomitiporia mediterranea MF3/22]
MANQTLDYGHPYLLFTRLDAEAVDPSWVPSFVSQIVTRQYFSVALLTALVYHAFITMDKEILELSTNFLPIVTTFLNAAGSPTLLSIIGGHLLISMKEAGERGANKGTSLRLSDMSDIVIAEDSPTGLPRDEGLLLA